MRAIMQVDILPVAPACVSDFQKYVLQASIPSSLTGRKKRAEKIISSAQL
jgi:hypothetical protein